ncbi:hypothetical protein [Hymenobacter cheonanensis]|uniref:hypothetical protein n=1 Tax=Hymenobacter sp. CA2-7 TaxID=3063993 RepID=UPI002713796D|nr:hypothetical protein [Hymenobacter sp. CA2-7]MDO7887133.1 hypothetical protein [Hymenobacter sp. CA2-7]
MRNSAGQVSFEPAGYVRLDWGRQPRSFAATCAIFNAAAQAMQQYGSGRVLVNQTEMQPFTSEEQLWISQQWLPAAVRDSGYRYGAVVLAANVLTRLATAFVTSTPVPGLKYRSFGNEPEALAWLLQQV